MRSALAVPLLPADEVSAPLTFEWTPTVLLVTSTETVQVCEAWTLPSVSVIESLPACAVSVALPPFIVVFAGDATVRPLGRVLVNARSVTGLALSLVMVNVSVLLLPGPIVAGFKLAVNVG